MLSGEGEEESGGLVLVEEGGENEDVRSRRERSGGSTAMGGKERSGRR